MAYKRMERQSLRYTWNAERVIAALQDWAREFGEPPRVAEWGSAERAPDATGRIRAQRWAREHPRWPTSATVYRCLGSWETAMEAAGLRERYCGPWELPLLERVRTAHRMSAQGEARCHTYFLLMYSF